MAEDLLERIEFTDDSYTVKQSLVRNKYRVLDSSGELVVKAKQKLFKMKEDFPFENADGETVFRVKADRRLDIAGDYGIIDEESGDTIAVLGKKFTIFRHVWTIKDPETDGLLATIKSRSAILEFLRSAFEFLSLIPHRYTIVNADGDQIGSINGKFSFRDTYKIEIGELGNVPKESVVAAAIAIDALEGN